MSPKRYKTVQEWIHPAEADAVAGVYGEASDAVRAYHSQYVRILADLGSDWEGRQKPRSRSSRNIACSSVKSRRPSAPSR
jgi:hypothetical protein